VVEHFRALAGSSPVPLLVYNIPYRTGQPLTWAALAKLAALPGVTGIKHATGAVDRDTVEMMAEGGDDPYVSPPRPALAGRSGRRGQGTRPPSGAAVGRAVRRTQPVRDQGRAAPAR
jgi:hypothetical protein